jgi:hypothetical protein
MRSAPDLASGEVRLEADGKPLEGEGKQDEPEPTPSEPEDEIQPDPEEKRNTPMAAKTKVKPKPKSKTRRQASNDTVVSRARRMLRSEMKKVAQSLGMETYDEAEFQKKLEEMRKSHESGLSASEQLDRKMKELEERNVALRAKVANMNKELIKARRDGQWKDQEMANMEIEHEIRRQARESGVRDEDYAIHKFRQHVNSLDDTDPDPDPKQYFEGLKKDTNLRFLFQEARVPAGPGSQAEKAAEVESQGAPQDQRNIPEQPPKPAASQAQSDRQDALNMENQEFRDYAGEKYGFRPGMSG